MGGIILTGAGLSQFLVLSSSASLNALLADGMVRLYRNYDPNLCSGPVQMVSAFRGLNEVLQVKRGSGVITDWKQSGGTLMVSGDSRIVRVWDAHTESQVMVCPLFPQRLVQICQNPDTAPGRISTPMRRALSRH